jgi:hypothetical protein
MHLTQWLAVLVLHCSVSIVAHPELHIYAAARSSTTLQAGHTNRIQVRPNSSAVVCDTCRHNCRCQAARMTTAVSPLHCAAKLRRVRRTSGSKSLDT